MRTATRQRYLLPLYPFATYVRRCRFYQTKPSLPDFFNAIVAPREQDTRRNIHVSLTGSSLTQVGGVFNENEVKCQA